MKSRIGFLTALLAGFALLVSSYQPASAEDLFESLFLLNHKDKRVAAVGVAAGVASTAGYFAMRDWKWSGHAHNTAATAFVVTTAGCMVLAPIVAAAVVNDRQLTSREVTVMEASCVVPIVGGLIMNAIWDAHPEWDEVTGAPRVVTVAHTRKVRAAAR